MLPLTEKLLNDAGGWQAMKAARALHAAGRVSEAGYEGGVLRGLVREGQTQYRAGLRIGGKSDIENLCTCRESKGRGLICAHALAVGLAVLAGGRGQETGVRQGAAPRSLTPESCLLTPESSTAELRSREDVVFKSEGDWERLALHLIVPPNLADAWVRGAVSLGVECSSRTGRRLCSALPRSGRFTVSADDLAALRVLLRLTGGALPGALALNRAQAEQVLEAFATSPRVTLGRGAAVDLAKELPVLRSRVPQAEGARSSTPALEVARPVGEAPKFVLKIEGSLNYLGAELEARSGDRRRTITSPGFRPEHPAEQSALLRLRSCGFEGPTPRGEWALRGEQAILGFFARALPELKKVWEVSVGSRFEHVTAGLERVTPRFEMQGSGTSWFETGFELTTESGERLSASEIRRLLASGRRTMKLKNQKTAVLDEGLLDEFEELLKDTNPTQIRPGTYRFDVRDAGYFGSFAQQQAGEIVSGGSGLDWRSELPFARKVQQPVLGPEWEILRPYQVEGVTWFNALYKNGMAGILADEMGLGKTVQTLAFLTTVEGPKLVVCPASLTVNWQREAVRFAPSLRPVVLAEATPAELRGLVAEERLLITSYALMRRDLEVLKGVEFGAVILDEAQQIKNPESQTAQAAHRLQGRARIALTGTPIENGVRDIWSVMQFLMPGYLGSRQSFRERYEIPIRDQPSGPQHQRLVQRLRPFLLRRTKVRVATEIPEKIEQVAYCELSGLQKELYSKVLRAARDVVQKRPGDTGSGGGKLAVFTALLRLRQVCCDPRLLGGDSERPAAGHSAKLDLLRELLAEAIEDDHRVLVFSQFSTMLGLIREELRSDGMECCYLDGSTKDRQAEVDRFQKGKIPVFLISLKAGGFGLNLTAADTVILYDPWWNPAVEAQAADRVHRIGQTRSVNVYRLVAKDSVEEKILALQERKRNIAADFIEGEQPLMEGLSFDDVCGLVE